MTLGKPRVETRWVLVENLKKYGLSDKTVGLFLHGRKDKLHNIGSNKRPILQNGNNLNKFERKVQQKAAVDEDILQSMFMADEKISTTNFDEIAKQMEEEYMSGDEEENGNNLANFIEETNSDDDNDANLNIIYVDI